ncbi:MAG TPA: fused MFS/spermidine synthase [bacterium]|jgi:spermidine synthase|nr:fused MFS/spermidine synthase [bacterium]
MAIKTEWVTDTFGHVYEGKSLYKGKTPFQSMEIFKSDTFGTLLFLDGKIQISEGDENRYHQYLVSAPLLAHANPRSVCVIGGGDCFSIEEAVKFPSLKRILMVEIDKGVVDFCRANYPAIKTCLKDPRVEIVYEDARAYLEREKESFDVLVVDLTEPHGPSKMLYTYEFYQLCARRLNQGGILSIHTDNYFLFPDSFATIRKTLGAVFKNIATARVDMPCFGMGWTYRLASASPIDLKRMEKNLAAMQKKRGQLDHLTPSLYNGKPTGEELKVLARHGRVSTDRAPYDKFEKLSKKVTK